MRQAERATRLTVAAMPGLEPWLVRPGLRERETLGEYREARPGPDYGLTGEALIEAIETAGLRGRGGAAFPTGAKLRSVADREGPRYVVANGEEGEPASVKDRWLLRMRPHLVLDGLLRCAAVVGAERAFAFVSDPEAARSVARAVEELGETAVPVELVTAEPAYVAGEETAVVRAIDGGPAKPTDKPPRPFEGGVRGRPTLVANVETLANVPLIAERGAAPYREIGSESSPGTFLLTLSGACANPGLYEAPLGIPLREAIAAGGADPAPAGFLMGGFFAGLLGPRALDAPLAYDELRAEGSGLGCGAIVVLGEGECPVAAAFDVMAYFARENAKQCGACIRGTAAMRDALAAMARGEATHDDLDRLRRWSLSLRGRGACALLDGAAGVAGSLLREYPELATGHVEGSCERCAAAGLDADAPTRFALDLA